MNGSKRQKVANGAPARREPAEATASQTSPDPHTEEESVTLDVASTADAAEAEEPKTFKELVCIRQDTCTNCTLHGFYGHQANNFCRAL